MVNSQLKKTYGTLYNETINRFNKLKELGYIVKYTWEHNWDQFNNKKNNTEFNSIINVH